MMRIAIQIRWLRGFQIGGDRGQAKEICHLLYADDTVIFCEPIEEQINYIRLILLFFETTSGLKVNWGKSNLFPIKEVANLQSLAEILGCNVEHLPTVYLGMPLGNRHKEELIWDGIVEKAEKRLTRWKTQYLSLGGRLTLINSVLDSLPTYVMSLFPLPSKILKKLDKLRRDFLWHGCKENKGYNLVEWDKVLNSRHLGGMGIRNLRRQNNSLLMKWLWRYNEEGQALWKEVIKCKCGEYSPWCSNVSSTPYGVGVWRTIRDLWPKLAENMTIKVGDGSKTKFRENAWKNQTPLKEDFPDLFIICNNPEATVNECWTTQGWDLSFRRLLNDWEVDRVASLLHELEGFSGTTSDSDSIRSVDEIDKAQQNRN